VELANDLASEVRKPANLKATSLTSTTGPSSYFLAFPSADLQNWFVCEASHLTSPIFFGTYEDAQLVAYLKNRKYLDSITMQRPAQFEPAPKLGGR
jgi:hypothetical protein